MSHLSRLGKGKDRPKVRRPDRTETVGPAKWAGPVSVQVRYGPFYCFGLGPKNSLLSISLLNPHSRCPSSDIPFWHLLNPHSCTFPQEEGEIQSHLGLSSELFFLSASRLIFRSVLYFKIFFVSVYFFIPL